MSQPSRIPISLDPDTYCTVRVRDLNELLLTAKEVYFTYHVGNYPTDDKGKLAWAIYKLSLATDVLEGKPEE